MGTKNSIFNLEPTNPYMDHPPLTIFFFQKILKWKTKIKLENTGKKIIYSIINKCVVSVNISMRVVEWMRSHSPQRHANKI